MRHSILVVTAFCMVVLGCGESGQQNSIVSSPGGLVSDFAAPDLQGLVIRDHPNGAEVVTPPDPARAQAALENKQAPFPMSLFYTRGAVLTAINGTRVRNAANFRELANAAAERGQPVQVAMDQP